MFLYCEYAQKGVKQAQKPEIQNNSRIFKDDLENITDGHVTTKRNRTASNARNLYNMRIDGQLSVCYDIVTNPIKPKGGNFL
jgi:hypothetical protein